MLSEKRHQSLLKNFLLPQYFAVQVHSLTNIWMKGNVCEGGGYIISVVIFSFVYNASKFLEFETTYYQQVESFVIFQQILSQHWKFSFRFLAITQGQPFWRLTLFSFIFCQLRFEVRQCIYWKGFFSHDHTLKQISHQSRISCKSGSNFRSEKEEKCIIQLIIVDDPPPLLLLIARKHWL